MIVLVIAIEVCTGWMEADGEPPTCIEVMLLTSFSEQLLFLIFSQTSYSIRLARVIG
jgi:hypothetical protein